MKRKTAISLLVILSVLPTTAFPAPGYLQSARQAAEWIRASAVRKDVGQVWLSDPNDKKSETTDLYSGSPGVVLFFLELSRSTRNASYLRDARAGADYLAKHFSEVKETGLYEGIAGIGFVLIETYRATGDDKYRQAALRVIRTLKERAANTGAGLQWSTTTDIISGNAGTGLFLIYAARELKDKSLLDSAISVGDRLIEVGKPGETVGTKWMMDDKFPAMMPNFSHGTAGIAYFLATLYKETGRRAYLNAAISGADYLKSIAETEGDSCMIFHNGRNGKKLFYLSWCHGPAGTARLFYRMFQVTGDGAWMDWVKRSARGIIRSEIPEKQTPGFWNNVSQCCGSAGVGEFSLSLYRVTKEKSYRDFTKRIAANLLSRSTTDGQGLKWVQAEHRVRPELLAAQTGFMQGAAGIGMFLLRLDAAEKNRTTFVAFPDTPF